MLVSMLAVAISVPAHLAHGLYEELDNHSLENPEKSGSTQHAECLAAGGLDGLIPSHRFFLDLKCFWGHRLSVLGLERVCPPFRFLFLRSVVGPQDGL